MSKTDIERLVDDCMDVYGAGLTPVHDAERERLKSFDWIQTASGGQFFPLNPRVQDVKLDDIAHALAQKNRFTGHSLFPHSVAAHSVLVSYLVPKPYALAGLLHDAAEAYLPDLAAPIKRYFSVIKPQEMVASFAGLEGIVLDVIFEALGFKDLRPLADSEAVKKADLIALATEYRDCMVHSEHEWNLTEEPDPDYVVREMGWEAARSMFLARFGELTRGGK